MFMIESQFHQKSILFAIMESLGLRASDLFQGPFEPLRRQCPQGAVPYLSKGGMTLYNPGGMNPSSVGAPKATASQWWHQPDNLPSHTRPCQTQVPTGPASFLSGQLDSSLWLNPGSYQGPSPAHKCPLCGAFATHAHRVGRLTPTSRGLSLWTPKWPEIR